jgi:hypothetical protein
MLDPEHHKLLQNVVFLVTPAFAKWFGADGAFLAAALEHIYGKFTWHDNMCGIQSSVAVVNRLPSRVRVSDRAEAVSSDEQVKPIYGHEGIALRIDSMRFGSDILSSPNNKDLVQPLVRMTFMHRLGGGTAIELPPANTLFVNGNQNTMFQDKWTVNPFIGPKLKRISPRQQLKTLEIFDEADAPNLSAPIEALTGRREIMSSMGNVIRQLKSQKDGEPVPASAELEEKVPQYLARRREKDGTLTVFALVLPPGVLQTLELNRPVQPSEEGLTKADLSVLRSALLAGAHLHHVTSGGGGWGKKQGLLSLDPAFDFAKHEDTGSLDAMLGGNKSGGRASSMNAISTGDLVQFFASYEPEQQVLQSLDLPNTTDVDTSDWDAMKWTESARLQTILGSLPSQDDFFMPLQDIKQIGSSIIGIPGYFGILSAGGTCLHRYKFERSDMQPNLNPDQFEGGRGKLKQVALSKMDIPYGFWNVQFVNPGISPSMKHVRMTVPSEEQSS